MPIALGSNLTPKNATNPDPALRGTYFLLEDIYLKGGMQVRATAAERDGINTLNRKAGMLVYTQDTKKIWILGDDLTTWSELQTGGGGGGATIATEAEALAGVDNTKMMTPYLTKAAASASGGFKVRKQIVHEFKDLAANSNGDYDVELPTGCGIAMLINCTVTKPCTVEIHGIANRADPNPYKFVATTQHLFDDGTTVMSDGSTDKGRRFSFLANLETPEVNKLYVRLYNTGTSALTVTLTLELIYI